MLRILILLFLVAVSSLFAGSYTPTGTSYITDFPVFVVGDVQSIESAFKVISKLMTDKTTIEAIISGIVVLLYFISTLKSAKQSNISSITYNTIYLMFGAMSLSGILSVSVHIEDQRTAIDYTKYGGVNYAKVDNIPFPIAAIISLSSTITLTLEDKVNDATVDIDSDGVSQRAIGFANAFNDVQRIVNYVKFGNDKKSSDYERALIEYVSTCVLEHAYYNGNADIMRSVRNPSQDIIKELDATKLNITLASANFVDSDSNNYSTCGEIYNFLTTNYSEVVDITIKSLENSVQSASEFDDLAEVTKMKIADSFISGKVGQYKAFIYNASTIGPISRAIRNSSGTTTSGQDLANSITLETSKAKIQAEGIGQFKWLAEVLPMGYHFLMGIIYVCGIFVLIISIALGYEKGLMLLSNYAQGLLTFEFVRVAMALANNQVIQYSKFHASDVLSALGSNLATVENIPYYLNYMATMAGIAGILGVSAVFLIPTIVFTGKVAAAAGALSGLSGRYAGNDIDTALTTTSQASAKNQAYEDMLKQHALEKAGYTPGNMAVGDYYNQLMNDLNSTSTGLTLASNNHLLNDAARGNAMSSLKDLTSRSIVGSQSTFEQHKNVGIAEGNSAVGNISGVSSFVSDNGADSLRQASKLQALKEKYSAKTMSEELTEANAIATSIASTSMQIGQDVQQLNSRKDAKLIGEDNKITDLTKKSMENRFDKESREFAGVGKANLTLQDLQNFENMAKGKFEEAAISASVYNKEAMDNKGELTKEYKEGLKGAEGSKITSMISTAKVFGKDGYQAQVDFAAKQAASKTSESKSDLEGKLKTPYYDEKTGMLTTEGYEILKSSSQYKTQQMIGSAKGLKNVIDNKEYLEDYIKKGLTAAKKENETRFKDVFEDLKKSGLVNGTVDNYTVDTDKWVEAKAFLNANNMNSQNALVAGGMVLSGALGKNSSVVATSQNSLTTGNRQETNEDVHVKNQGNQLNYNPLIDNLGLDTLGEIATGLLQGATVLAALDFLSGGKVRKSFGNLKEKQRI